MTYCIMTVIYGVPLTERAHELINGTAYDEEGNELELAEDDDTGIGTGDAEACGFETLYSGSASWMPGFCGVQISEFDECEDAIRVKDLLLVPTEAQKKEAQAKVDALDPRIKALCPEIDVYLIPNSS